MAERERAELRRSCRGESRSGAPPVVNCTADEITTSRLSGFVYRKHRNRLVASVPPEPGFAQASLDSRVRCSCLRFDAKKGTIVGSRVESIDETDPTNF